MTIKVGDIVRYNNKEQRVMGMLSLAGNTTLSLSHEGNGSKIRTSEVTLIEPFIRPDIKIGDCIRILPIPSEERGFYIDANKPIDDDVYEVVGVWESSRSATVIDIVYNGHKRHYMAHYVEKIREYDMI